MRLTIYSKNQSVLFTDADFSYQGTFMGERYMSARIESPVEIDFLPEDWVEFRNERFVLDYTPTATKTGSPMSKGDAFVYDLKFVSLRHELEKCIFRDIVPFDNQQHYTGLTNVEFTGDVKQLADRIKANLDVLYPNAWTIVVTPDTQMEVKNISTSDQNCMEALALVQSEYGLSFTIKNRTVTIGTVGVEHGYVFMYGEGKGLYSITRTSVDSEAVVTRLRAYGSSENLPRDYKKKAGSLVPLAQYIPCLMLPNYETTLIDYIQASADKVAIYRIREGVFRDDSIKPSIKEMTGEQIRAAGGASVSNGRIDEVVSVTPISSETQSYFAMSIKDIGFNIKDYLGDDKPMIEFTDGRLGGVSCEILNVFKTATGYNLELARNTDSSFPLPDQITTCSAGDHFVITGIFMPELYVKAAEQRLLTKAQSYLAEFDHAKSTYGIGIDEIFMADNQLKDVIFEGDLLKVKDTSLSIDASIIIQQLNIKTNAQGILQYEVTLSDKPVATTLNRVQDKVTNVEKNVTVVRRTNETAARRNVSSLRRLKDYAFDPETGKFRTENLEVGSIDSLFLSVGSKASNFSITAFLSANYQGDASKMYLGGGTLVHREISHGLADIDSNYVWVLPAAIHTFADSSKVYYIYAKCSTSSSVSEWFVSERMLRYNNETLDGWYYFKLGVVYDVVNGVRGSALDYGVTLINGRTITTGKIQSANGGTYFDLDNNELRIGAGSSGLENLSEWSSKQAQINSAQASAQEANNYINSILPSTIAGLQSQIDGNITSWFFDYEPSLANIPASNWTSDAVRDIHLGDLFYWTSNGYSYRFQKVGATYSWTRIPDTDVTKALADAAKAQDTADSKRRTFISQPSNAEAYDVGDMWVNATAGVFSNDILKCITPKAVGAAFSISHWDKAGKYTDDTAVDELQIGGRNLLTTFGLGSYVPNNSTPSYDALTNTVSTTINSVDSLSMSCTKVGNYVSGIYTLSGYISRNGLPLNQSVWLDVRFNKYFPLIKGFVNSDGYFEITQSISNNNNPFFLDVPLPIGTVVGDVFTLRNLKFEKGSKATDYTPAIEDTQADIDSAQQTADNAHISIGNLNTYVDGAFKDGVVSEAEATVIDKLNKQVNSEFDRVITDYNTVYANVYLTGAAKTDLLNAKVTLAGAKDSLQTSINNAIADGKTTAAEKADVDGKFTIYKNAFTDYQSKLSNAGKAVQVELDRLAGVKVDELQIGGRNLLTTFGLGSYVPNNSTPSYNALTNTVSTTINSVDSLSMSCTKVGNYVSGIYTLSGYISRNGLPLNQSVWLDVRFNKYFPLIKGFVNSDGYFEITQSISNNNNPFFLDMPLPIGAVVGDVFTLRNLKFEKGSKATDYTPAIEDTQAGIDAAKAAAATAQADATLAKARTQGRTVVNGGVVETQIVQLGTGGIAGISGIKADANGNPLPSRWAGGTYEQAVAGTATVIERFDGSVKSGDFSIGTDGTVSIKDATGVDRVIMSKKDIMPVSSLTSVVQNSQVTNSSSEWDGSGTLTRELPFFITVNNNNSKLSIKTSMRAIATSNPTSEPNGDDGYASSKLYLYLKNRSTNSYVSRIGSVSVISMIRGSLYDDAGVDAELIVDAGTYSLELVFTHSSDNGSTYSRIEQSEMSVSFDASVKRMAIGKNGMSVIGDARNHVFSYFENGVFNVIHKCDGIYDVPGILATGSISSGGSDSNRWGPKLSVYPSVRLGVGRYKIYHNIGRFDYTVGLTSTTDGVDVRCVVKGTDYINVNCRDGSNILTDASFDYELKGNNQ